MIKDKVVIITGASQGLGKELAIQIAGLGAKVALVSRNETELKKVKDTLNKSTNIAEYFVCDITKPDQVNNVVEKIIAHFGNIDILINNAGIWTTDELEEKRPELIEIAFNVNAIGTIYFTKAILVEFKKNNSGQILNIISKAGLDIYDNKDWPTYAASKWAITGYTKALNYALAETKIKISAFYPGGFESNIFETAGETEAHNQPWMMRTEDVANAVVSMLNTPEDLHIKSVEVSNI